MLIDTRPVPEPSRRRLLAGALAVTGLGLTGCGRVRIGQPAPFTPPPPGIDDLYRRDLVSALTRLGAGMPALREHADDALDALLAPLAATLKTQREALLTGAEAEREEEARTDPAPGATPSPTPTGLPADPPALVAQLVALRDLGADAALQVSGSLAAAVCGIAANAQWSALRLHAAGHGAVPATPSEQQLHPARAVPTQDPPSIGARSDYETAIQSAQQEEWYAGYVFEVLAAISSGKRRDAFLASSTAHRDRAEELAGIAEADSAPVVHREAVYALPGGQLSGRSAEQMPRLLAHALLLDHVHLVGAAPFERRALPIAAALAEATALAPLAPALEAVPGLTDPER